MAWAALTDGSTEYLELDVALASETLGGTSIDWSLELEQYHDTDDYIYGPDDASFSNFINLRQSSGDVDYRRDSVEETFSAVLPSDKSEPYKVRLEGTWASTENIKRLSLYVNDVFIETRVTTIDIEVMDIRWIERVNTAYRAGGFVSLTYVDNNNSSNNVSLSSTDSDHNSGSDPVTDPFIVSDTSGNSNDATGVNMTTANWIDLGGDTSVVEDIAITYAITDNSADAITLTDSTAITYNLVDNSTDSVDQSVVEDIAVSYALTDNSTDIVSLIENSEITFSLADSSVDIATIADSMPTSYTLSDSSTDEITVTESVSIDYALTDNSTDAVEGNVVESIAVSYTLIDNSVDTVILADSVPVDYSLADNSTDFVVNGVIENAPITYTLIDNSVDTIVLSDFVSVDYSLVDNSSDLVGQEVIIIGATLNFSRGNAIINYSRGNENIRFK